MEVDKFISWDDLPREMRNEVERYFDLSTKAAFSLTSKAHWDAYELFFPSSWTLYRSALSIGALELLEFWLDYLSSNGNGKSYQYHSSSLNEIAVPAFKHGDLGLVKRLFDIFTNLKSALQSEAVAFLQCAVESGSVEMVEFVRSFHSIESESRGLKAIVLHAAKSNQMEIFRHYSKLVKNKDFTAADHLHPMASGRLDVVLEWCEWCVSGLEALALRLPLFMEAIRKENLEYLKYMADNHFDFVKPMIANGKAATFWPISYLDYLIAKGLADPAPLLKKALDGRNLSRIVYFTGKVNPKLEPLQRIPKDLLDLNVDLESLELLHSLGFRFTRAFFCALKNPEPTLCAFLAGKFADWTAAGMAAWLKGNRWSAVNQKTYFETIVLKAKSGDLPPGDYLAELIFMECYRPICRYLRRGGKIDFRELHSSLRDCGITLSGVSYSAEDALKPIKRLDSMGLFRGLPNLQAFYDEVLPPSSDGSSDV